MQPERSGRWEIFLYRQNSGRPDINVWLRLLEKCNRLWEYDRNWWSQFDEMQCKSQTNLWGSFKGETADFKDSKSMKIKWKSLKSRKSMKSLKSHENPENPMKIPKILWKSRKSHENPGSTITILGIYYRNW